LKKIVFLLLLVSSLACGLFENVSTATPTTNTPSSIPTALETKGSTIPIFCEVRTGTEDGGLLNLREGPGVNYTPVRVLHEGEVIVLANIPAQNGWQSVKVDSTQGWVNATYIDCEVKP
jgi:uncharacterized protein YraI